MYKRQFIVLDPVQLDNCLYRKFTGNTYSETNLRLWAQDRWRTPLNASLAQVARDIKTGGWELFEYIVPMDPEPGAIEPEEPNPMIAIRKPLAELNESAVPEPLLDKITGALQVLMDDLTELKRGR